MRRISSLIVLLALLAGGYYWYTHYYAPRRTAAGAATWKTVTPADGARGRAAVQSLRAGSGKVFASLTAPEAVGYLLDAVTKQLPSSTEGVQTMIEGDTLRVRAVVPLAELAGRQALGPLAVLLSGRDTVQLSGTTDMVRPGLAQVRITNVRVRSLDLPSAAIPKIIARLRQNAPEGIAPNALPLPLPPYVGDIRIGNGKITLYKNV